MSYFVLAGDGLVDINKEWLGSIEEYRKIIRRDRGSKGDHDGRKKEQARRELTFIYHYCKFDSDFADYNEEERYIESLKASGLPEDTKIKEDEELLNAIERFEKNQPSRSLKLLRATRKSVDQLTSFYESITFSGADTKKVKEYMMGMGNLSKLLDQLSNMESRVRLEMAEEGAIRADANKGLNEDSPVEEWREE